MRASTQKNIARAGVVFTVVDAVMTAGFGFLASSVFIMKPVLAAGLGAISYTLAFLPVVAVACWARGWKPVAALIMFVYVGGFVGNFFSNYGLSAALFKGNVIQAENKNQTHADKREVVKRLRAEDAKLAEVIGSPGSWLSVEDAEKALQRTLKAKEREGNRKYCGPKCEALDAKAVAMRIEISKARKREDAITRRQSVQKKLAKAEAEADDAPKHVSVAAAQSEYLARIFSGSLKPDGDTVDWTLMGTSVAISLFVSIFAHLCNLIPSLNLANIREEDEQEAFNKREWLPSPPDHSPQPAQAFAPPQRNGDVNVSLQGNGEFGELYDSLSRIARRAEARLQSRRGASI